MTRGRAVLALALALLVSAPVAGAADVRTVEAVGVIPLDTEAPPQRAPRDLALRAALFDAVWRVALEHLPGMDRTETDSVLTGALGNEPRDYINRFRILEDRGERPALFIEDPEVENEYVVLVEVRVDADRVRERLADAGLLVAPSGEGGRVRLRVVIEDLESYRAYAALRRTLLEDLLVRSALPVMMEHRRIVLEVEADRGAAQLRDELLRAAPEGLRITPLRNDDQTLVLRVQLTAETRGETRRGVAAPHAIDTPDRNRY